MKKWGRLLAVLMMAAAMVVLAGCGEKDKFAKAQTEVMQLLKQAENVSPIQVSNYKYNPNASTQENLENMRIIGKADAQEDLKNIQTARDEHKKSWIKSRRN